MAATIDALGQPCPIPVVKAKQAIAALPPEGGVITVLVDNRIACENLAKMAKGLGHEHEMREAPDGSYMVVITVGAGGGNDVSVLEDSQALPILPESGRGLVVAVGSDCMGRGSEELGRILIKGFLFSLTQLEPAPQAVLFFNSGVRLVLEDANTVADVRALIDRGCKVLVCGTCVDYYQCTDLIAAGEITNMYGIVEEMNAGGRIVSI